MKNKTRHNSLFISVLLFIFGFSVISFGVLQGVSADTVDLSGDAWQVGTSTKDLEISENLDGIAQNRENFYNITTFIEETELGALAEGVFENRQGSFQYEQFIYWDNQLSGITGSQNVVYTEDDNDVAADFLYIKSGENVGRYVLEFRSSAESDITNSEGEVLTVGTYLWDFQDEKLSILGRGYTIISARRPEVQQDSINLTLLRGALRDILDEGTSKVHSLGGAAYDVTLDFVGSTTALFTVNGERTDHLREGDVYRLSDGVFIAVKSILVQEFAGGTRRAEFFLGASKVVLTDNDVSDSISSYPLVFNEETVDDAAVTIRGTGRGTTFNLDSITINITADDDLYVPAGGRLSDHMTEPGALLDSWDIEYHGLSEPQTELIRIKTSGRDQYALEFQDRGGDQVVVPIAYTGSGAALHFGDDDDDLIIDQTQTITKNDYVIVADDTKEVGRRRPTYALRYKGADKDTRDNPVVEFAVLTGSGTDRIEKSYTLDSSTGLMVATLRLGGANFNVYNASSSANDDFDVWMDLDGDGILIDVSGRPDPSEAGNLAITTPAGAQLQLTDNSTTSSITFTLSTPNEDDYENLKPTDVVFTITAENGEVRLHETGAHRFRNPEDVENMSFAYTSLGAFMKWFHPIDDPGTLTVLYPEVQRVPLVFVTSDATTRARLPRPRVKIAHPLERQVMTTLFFWLNVTTNQEANCTYEQFLCFSSHGVKEIGGGAGGGGGGCERDPKKRMHVTGGTLHTQLVANYSNTNSSRNEKYFLEVACINTDDRANFDSVEFTVNLSMQEPSCTIPTAGMIITENTTFCKGEYELPNGVQIGANNVVLDCDGASLYGGLNLDAPLTIIEPSDDDEETIDETAGEPKAELNFVDSPGIYVEAHREVTIENCVVREYDQGIELKQTNYSVLRNNVVYNISNIGIWLEMSHNNLLENNYLSNIHHSYLIGELSTGNVLYNNHQRDGTFGYTVQLTENNTLINNTARDNQDGFNVVIAKNIQLINNTSYGGWARDYYFVHVSNSSLKNNKAINGSGIFVSGGGNNSIFGNVLISPSATTRAESLTIAHESHGNKILSNQILNGAANEFYDGIFNIKLGHMQIQQSNDNYIAHNVVNNSGYGILLHGSENNTITMNNLTYNRYGMGFSGFNRNNTIEHNNIYGSDEFNIFRLIFQDYIVVAHNYWGTTNQTEINKSIFDFHNGSSLGVVEFCPFLNAPWPEGEPVECVFPLSLNVHFPTEVSTTERRIPFNITLSEEVDLLSYINHAERRSRERRLCRNCEEYGSERERLHTFRDGFHDLEFIATKGDAMIKENVSFFIDSRLPRVRVREPRNRGYTNGTFVVEYQEEHPAWVTFNHHNDVVWLSPCNNTASRRTVCSYHIDISEFDSESFEYWFEVEDVAGNVGRSREAVAHVDVTPPNITKLNTAFDRGRLEFDIEVSEKVTLAFFDKSDPRPRWKSLCRNCDSYNRKKPFRRDSHSIIIRATDRAGNTDSKTVALVRR